MGKPRDLANVVATGNILADGAVAPAELTGVTSTAAEINILDGVTSTAAELNILDGVTATTTELNYVDGVTSAIQTQINTKSPIADPTFTGTATAPTVNASTALQIGGVAVTATAAELNKMDGVTVSASDINAVTAKLPLSGGTLTGDIAHASNFTISAGTNVVLDAGGTIILDADNGAIALKDGGVQVGSINMTNTDLQFVTEVDNRDMIFTGKDDGSFITALTLDMSDAGKATFNSDVVAPRFVDSGNSGYYVDPFATSVLAYAYLQQSYGFNTALSGTTPTINAGQFNSFSLTTSGNTTFTFSVNSVATGYLIGFVLKLTAGGGHTITYPNTVDFAGGTAPDAPASGETDILVFTTIDAGTTWYGARAIDAAA